MAEGSVNVTEGSGKRFHTWDRTISSTLVQTQGVFIDEFPYASYSITARGISIATAADHVIQVMAGSSTYTRIRRIRLEQDQNVTSATATTFDILRLTTAGTGGTTVTPAKNDNGDSAASTTAQTLPSSKGTESTVWASLNMSLRQTVATAGSQYDDFYEWTQLPNQKPLIIPAGTSNGIAIKTISGRAGATMVVHLDIVETAWLGA